MQLTTSIQPSENESSTKKLSTRAELGGKRIE